MIPQEDRQRSLHLVFRGLVRKLKNKLTPFVRHLNRRRARCRTIADRFWLFGSVRLHRCPENRHNLNRIAALAILRHFPGRHEQFFPVLCPAQMWFQRTGMKLADVTDRRKGCDDFVRQLCQL